jgi:hypothetical protein
MRYKRETVIPFDDIFNFATKEYGIGWNPCNDLFFGNAFEYREHSYIEYDGVDYVGCKATRDSINDLDSLEKANAIVSHFMQVHKLT